MKWFLKIILFFLIGLTLYYFLDPYEFTMPVKGAGKWSYNQNSFSRLICGVLEAKGKWEKRF
jgi:hypothetical protein